ncbi:MAG: DUF3857 domain-containing protein, partial [Planctomycetes bacterium]|nr:DUF3857 domain-containing protein [Planctomycetota bacterium]
TERLTIHAARTWLPGGGTLDVPRYAVNLASPGDVAGWPAFAEWRQTIVSFMGLAPGAVVELDFEIAEAPGATPFSSGELRVGERDPTVWREVSFASPPARRIRAVGLDLPPLAGEGRWVLGPVDAWPDEPRGPSWLAGAPVIRFTDAPDAAAFARSFLAPAEGAATGDGNLAGFARAAAGDSPDPEARLLKLADRLRAGFTVIDSPRAFAARRCRPAPEVLDAGYGNPLEAAALLAAAARSLGFAARLRLALDRETFEPAAPGDGAFAGLLVEVSEGGLGESLLLEFRRGRVRRDGAWTGLVVLGFDPAGALGSEALPARGASGSMLRVTGALALSDDGKLTGELRAVLTGLFFDPAAVAETKGREVFLSGLSGRIVKGLAVSDHSILELGPDRLAVRLTVSSPPLPRVADHSVLESGDGPIALDTFPIPLDGPERRTPVVLPGPFREEVEVVVRPPGPSGMEPIRLHREFSAPARLEPAALREIRMRVAAMRAPAERIHVIPSR